MTGHEPFTISGEVWHVGRSWGGHAIEDDCPCEKAPCGLVAAWSADCPHHAPQRAKTLRQSHLAQECPGTEAP